MGGDLRALDDATLALLTNDEVLAVNQHSRGGRELRRGDGQVVWTAQDARSRDRFVVLFNVSDAPLQVAYEVGPGVRVRDLWARQPVRGALAPILPPHGSALYRLS